MRLNADALELLALLNANSVEYVLVGARAEALEKIRDRGKAAPDH
jgi:hypothetical protein